MKTIAVGERNDISLYAIRYEGRYYPLTDDDLEHEQPDAKIKYDSGIYPGITLEELPQYICNKAGELSSAAAALGRKGGQSTSDAKAAAARANGKRGGRPPKQS